MVHTGDQQMHVHTHAAKFSLSKNMSDLDAYSIVGYIKATPRKDHVLELTVRFFCSRNITALLKITALLVHFFSSFRFAVSLNGITC
jgi:hypothetical protein